MPLLSSTTIFQVETVVTYNDEDSSEEDYDPYLERMKAEGEERDSEDGRTTPSSLLTCRFVVCVCVCACSF